MRRGSIFVILFAVVAVGVIAASQFLRSQPALEVRLAVSPLVEDWVREAADRFNATNPLAGTQPLAIRVQVQDDVGVWQVARPVWNAADHPDGWIPALSASAAYANSAQLPFQIRTPSTARTLLVWGMFESRAQAASITTLDWPEAQTIAAAERWDALPNGRTEWGFVKFAFSNPANTASGVGALLSGASSLAGTFQPSAEDLTGQPIRDFMRPVLASVPNFNTLGTDPAAVLTRGPSAGEVALLPESQWLTNLSGISAREPILLTYPAYPFVFDFPLAVWSDSATPQSKRDALEQFSAWLLQTAQQERAIAYGLRPVERAIRDSDTLFNAAVASGIQLQPELSQAIEPPDRETMLRMLAWISGTR